jgi:predicted membrane protein
VNDVQIRRSVPQLVLGLLIVCLGVALTLDSLGIADAERLIRFWPAGLIAIGLAKLWQCRGSFSGMLGGLVLTAIGTFLLLGNLGIVHVSIVTLWRLWPLFLVLFGTSLVWRSLAGRRPAPNDSNSVVSAVAVLSGVNRGNNSASFRGGDLTAVMGGCEVDLRQAQINGEAVIDVFAMWGGIEIRVPQDWTVVSQVTPLLGGFDDKTRPTQTASVHRLVIRGFVIMGGIEVKN